MLMISLLVHNHGCAVLCTWFSDQCLSHAIMIDFIILIYYCDLDRKDDFITTSTCSAVVHLIGTAIDNSTKLHFK